MSSAGQPTDQSGSGSKTQSPGTSPARSRSITVTNEPDPESICTPAATIDRGGTSPASTAGGARSSSSPSVPVIKASDEVREYQIEVKWSKADESQVDSFLDRARQGLHCSLFCGGKTCKHESWDYFLRKRTHQIPPAFEGLNSSWVGEHVVASQRPASTLFLKYLLVQQFKKSGLTGVFNLQEKGEHSSCGPDGIYTSSGYSYDGEKDLMRYGISYHEFPWPDMTAPNNDIVLRSVQVMHHHVQHKGKVLVHCHAGLGRTGLLIACFLIFAYRMPAEEAITVVRSNRPGAVQTRKQVEFIRLFETHLRALLQAFRVEVSDGPVTLKSFIQRQKLFLHGDDSRMYRLFPKHLHLLLCRLIECGKEDLKQALIALRCYSVGATMDEAEVNQARLEINRGFVPDDLKPHVAAYVLLDWVRRCSEPVLSAGQGELIVQYQREIETERVDLPTAIQTIVPDKVTRATVELLLSGTSMLGKIANDAYGKRFGLHCLTDALFQFHIRTSAIRFGGHEKHLIYDFMSDWAAYVSLTYFPLSLSSAGVPSDAGALALLTPAQLGAVATLTFFGVLGEENSPGGSAERAADGDVGEVQIPATAEEALAQSQNHSQSQSFNNNSMKKGRMASPDMKVQELDE